MSDSKEKPEQEDKGHRKVEVKVDKKEHKVDAGTYLVSDFKKLVGIPENYDLDQLIDGKFVPLADDKKVEIKGGEVFVSHVRTGGSSHD